MGTREDWLNAAIAALRLGRFEWGLRGAAMKFRPYKQAPGQWVLVSSRYEPPSRGSVGSGCIICTPYRTRALARAAAKRENRK